MSLAHQEQLLPEVVAPTDWFDAFWKAYPRKVAKPAARKAFTRALRKTSIVTIAEGLAAWRAYWAEKDEPEFVPHPTTWLNQERWNDEPPQVRSRNNGIAALSQCLADNGIRLSR